MGFELPEARTVAVNPTQEEMRAWVLEYMERVTVTEFGNIQDGGGHPGRSGNTQ